MRAATLLALLVLASCVGPEDNPTKVIDLRVLAAAFEPPELMAPSCDLASPQNLALYATPVSYTALVADPAGAGRSIDYELLACARVSDRTCDDEGEFLPVASGSMPAGELSLTLQPGTWKLPDGSPLLSKVLELDTFKGLGGLRMPLVLHLKAGDEEIYAQKIMLFSCRFFADQKANVTPRLPGISIDGRPWTEQPQQLEGPGPFEVRVDELSALQEAYLVPSYELQPVHLTESWKLTWHTTRGSFSPGETGGTDLGGGEGRHFVEWRPGSSTPETEVSFWIVVRDGRGGTSWLSRSAHYRP